MEDESLKQQRISTAVDYTRIFAAIDVLHEKFVSCFCALHRRIYPEDEKKWGWDGRPYVSDVLKDGLE